MLTPLVQAMLGDSEIPNQILMDALVDEGVDVASVYIVSGSHGEFSDRNEWDVAAFLDETAATLLCNQLNQWCKDNLCYGDDFSGNIPEQCPLDPNFRTDHYGTSYYISKVQLKG